MVLGSSWPKLKSQECFELGLRSPSRWHIWFFDWATQKGAISQNLFFLKWALNCANVFLYYRAIVGPFSKIRGVLNLAHPSRFNRGVSDGFRGVKKRLNLKKPQF